MPPLCIGRLNDKAQLKLQLLYLNVWQLDLLQTRSLIFGMPLCILESQSGQKCMCVVTANLWLTVPACLLPPYPRNQPWLLIIVREAIAAGYLHFNWKDSKSNPADILSKHWEFATIWSLLKPLLFWKGDTSELTTKTKGSDRIS